MSEAVARQFWERLQARDWDGVRALLRHDAALTWWTSREKFHGGDAIVKVNRVYPEGWTIVPRELFTASDGRVVTVVRVDHGAQSFYATSFFTIPDAKITAIEEYWATVEPPPAWRAPGFIAGHAVF